MAFIEYQPGRRYDPATGQAQWFSQGDWKDVGKLKYDPHTGQVTINDQDVDPRMLGGGPGQLNLGIGANRFPSLQQLRQFAYAPQAGSADATAAGATQGRPSYLGAAPQIGMGDGSGAGGAGGGGGTIMPDGNLTPEQRALAQMGQTDPATEALRQQLAQSYGTPLQLAGTPSAAQFQSYLDLYRQVDPTSAAARQQLGSDLAAQEALGTQLDAATQREVEQATRRAQGARGNVYGTPQLVQEAMTRGQAGLALQQQRQQALQGYLQSGQTMGDVAMNLYNQQQQQLRANQGAALGYLGSGQTPLQAGASYLSLAEQRAAAAAQGGPQYNPQALGQQYTGAGAPSFPQYGLDMSQLAGNWYNNINAANMQAAQIRQAGAGQKSQQGSALGSGIGTAIGTGIGALFGGVGAPIGGALGGALGGAAGSYFG